MAITLKVQDYCADCFDFEPNVTKPQRAYDDNGEVFYQTDTLVECKYAKRCEAIKRYLRMSIYERGGYCNGE